MKQRKKSLTLKRTNESIFNIPDKIFWEKIKKEKRIYNRNRKNGYMVDERTGNKNEY